MPPVRSFAYLWGGHGPVNSSVNASELLCWHSSTEESLVRENYSYAHHKPKAESVQNVSYAVSNSVTKASIVLCF